MFGLHPFVSAGLGGVIIGLSAAWFLLSTGRIAGISGVIGRIFDLDRSDRSWRLTFALGLLCGGAVAASFVPSAFEMTVERSTGALLAAGLIAGVGTQFGNGCTTGHGVCGMGRFSKRSVAATLAFILAGAATVLVVNRFFGGVI